MEIVNQLKAEWSLNPQYSYGWLVPLLASFLLWKRWDKRPATERPRSATATIGVVVLFGLGLLPLRFVAEANPDWRLVSWCMALTVAGSSLAGIYYVGGRPWVRHFAFPILFFLVAVPWPAQVEQGIVQTLMGWNTGVNVAMLNFLGIGATQHGNVIEVANGLIGIEEACSGVRSLQATFMVSLFLGELYDFSVSRRSILVAVGAALAFLCNLLRTALLVWVGAKRGLEAIGRWHDPAGWIILILCILGLWLTSLWIGKKKSAARAEPARSGLVKAPQSLPWSLLLFLGLWIGAIEFGVSRWFAVQPAHAAVNWDVTWPVTAPGYKEVPIAPEAQSLLRYNEGGGGSWFGPDEHRYVMYFFRWLPGRTAALYVRNHRPDICLPATGMTLRGDRAMSVSVNNLTLPVRSYRFDHRQRPLHVYYCYWNGRPSSSMTDANEDWTAAGRLRAAWRGERDNGTQMLELIVWGYSDDGTAEDALKRELERLIAVRT